MTRAPRTLTEAVDAICSGACSSSELVEQALDAAERYDDKLGVFLSRFDEQARADAASADRAIAGGASLGPLHGIPVGVKDIIATREGPSTSQSPAMPAPWGPEEATVVQRLRDAGAIVIGKTSTLEFAYGLPDPTLPFPVPTNPWDVSRWPGGSSSGSGAGVAAGMMLGALGTDTGGSVRVPAAMCGISGLKPTTGTIDDHGLVPLAASVDTIGPMARSARDCAVLLAVMTGSDAPAAIERLDGLRVGVATMAAMSGAEADPAIAELLDDAVAQLESLGATAVPVDLPLYEEVVDSDYLTIVAERLSWHRPHFPDNWDRYGADARSAMLRAAHYTAADYVQAQRVRRMGQNAVAALFADIDLIVSPMCSRTAPPITELGDCMSTWKSLVHAPYWNALGNPAASVPMGFAGNGLPIGLQLIGRPRQDAFVLQVAEAYQQVTDWHLRTPDLARIDGTEAGVPIAAPVAPGLETLDPGALELARELLHRSGIAPSVGDLASLTSGMAAARRSTDRLWNVACGDEPGALALSYPEV
ncbi:amidase [Nocardioides alcanivorans]|uniref:amidase n=1 Tax=Nocardioides alcanivorans TaxID=2897352 RepID=UPI001F239BF8|nr:amidase [Nocardioides alcanivorans]